MTKDTDFLTMDPSAHAGVLFVGDHRTTAYEIATAIVRLVDAVPDWEHLREVVDRRSIVILGGRAATWRGCL